MKPRKLKEVTSKEFLEKKAGKFSTTQRESRRQIESQRRARNKAEAAAKQKLDELLHGKTKEESKSI